MNCETALLLIPIYFPTFVAGIVIGNVLWFFFIRKPLQRFLQNKFDKDAGKTSASKHTQPPRG